MYKKRNIGRGNGMWGTRGMGECYILGNVAKHSGDCPQTFRRMLLNIAGNIAKHSGECPQTFRGMSPKIPGNILKHPGECCQTFRGVLPSILGNIAKYSGECCQTFQEMLPIFRVKGSVVFRILSNIHDRALLRK